MDTIAAAQVSQARLIQFRQDGQPRVALVEDAETVQPLAIEGGTYDLAQRAIQEGRSIREIVAVLEKNRQLSYQELIDAGVIMPPITHPILRIVAFRVRGLRIWAALIPVTPCM